MNNYLNKPVIYDENKKIFGSSQLVVSVKCTINAYVIEMLIVQVLYMICKLDEARVYFIAPVLSHF